MEGVTKGGNSRGAGGLLKEVFFSGDLSEIVEFLINNSSSVEQAFSYLVLPVFKISIDRFHCPATKKKIRNRPVEEAKKMNCYKRLIYKQFV